MYLDTSEIIHFLRTNVEPLENQSFGKGYRASVYLTDGTFLPCVTFRSSEPIVKLAVNRFKEELSGKTIFSKSSGLGYLDIVKTFVTHGNCINYYDIAKVEISKFAIPFSILKQIEGETTMGWTGFAAKMNDDKYLGFGTSFSFEFLQIPDAYTFDQIKEIINHSYVLNTGELRFHQEAFSSWPNDYKDAVVYRERPFFECYLDGL